MLLFLLHKRVSKQLEHIFYVLHCPTGFVVKKKVKRSMNLINFETGPFPVCIMSREVHKALQLETKQPSGKKDGQE